MGYFVKENSNMFLKYVFLIVVSVQFVYTNSIFVHNLNNQQSSNFAIILKSYQHLLKEEPNDLNQIKLLIMNFWLKEYVKSAFKRRIVLMTMNKDWYLRQG
jgi:hypothetical protein